MQTRGPPGESESLARQVWHLRRSRSRCRPADWRPCRRDMDKRRVADSGPCHGVGATPEQHLQRKDTIHTEQVFRTINKETKRRLTDEDTWIKRSE